MTRASRGSVMWLPFAYRARVARTGKRTPARVVLSGRIPVAASAIARADAPVAAVVGRDAFRIHDGRWMKAVKLRSGDPASEVDFQDAARDASVAAWDGYPLCDTHSGLPDSPFAPGVESDERLPEGWSVKSSERGVREGFARAIAARLAVIDGMMWEECPEPFLAVRAERNGVSGDLLIEVRHHPDQEVDCAFFRLDRMDAAEEYAGHVAREFRKRRPSIPEIELRGDLRLAFDAGRAMAERIGWVLAPIRRLLWVGLEGPKSSADGERFARVADAVDRYVAGGDPFPVLAATSALLLDDDGEGRYANFLRRGFLPVMEAQLIEWSAAYGEGLAMTEDEEAVVAAMTP